METKLTKRRLEWLGHVARMSDQCMPKKALFGWLPQTRPQCGPRKCWRDLQAVGVPEQEWYGKATLSRRGWRTIYSDGLQLQLDNQQQQQEDEPGPLPEHVWCELRDRSFRRESDKKRHKCLAERLKPVQEQHGAVQCAECQWWFYSKGGLAVHRCHT